MPIGSSRFKLCIKEYRLKKIFIWYNIKCINFINIMLLEERSMKTFVYSVVIGIVILIYGLLNYYIGLRGWQFLVKHIAFINSKVYWIGFWVIVFSYIASRLGSTFLPNSIAYALKYIGSYWLGAMFYFLLIFIIVDVLHLLIKWSNILNFIPQLGSFPPIAFGLLIFLIVITILIYGTWNAKNPQVVTYNISIPKETKNYSSLEVVLVSDIHLGTIVNNERLNDMVAKINALEPDIVLMAGDIIDENVKVFVEQGMVETFKKLKPKIGSYAVLGNHEYIGGSPEDAKKHLQEAGIKVLTDSYINVENSFYIVGRDDKSGSHFTGEKRKNLAEILEGVDKTKPILLLDHQPTHLEEADKEGVDLQLSGHTHRGQLFPNHLITQKIFEVDWGYLKKENLQVIVSSGFGTWGPPIRVGNKPELVQIKIDFIKNTFLK